ncbi:hypothetical protein LJB95_01060, partial [Paludibacteraceae bacterium OttesenSCG-928-F17]|nr:hypothetical protein [Paludibacteraceae bacterium OttesenSCG-928-F17]
MQKEKNWFLKRFTSIEVLTFLYAIFTAVYILCLYNRIENPIELLLYRAGVSGIIIFLAWLYDRFPVKIVELMRFAFPLVIIMYWYPETYYLTHGVGGEAVLIPNLDAFFDRLDVRLFGCTPAMDFSAALPYRWFSEI